MVFNLKRFFYGVKRRLFWLVLALLIPLLYFAGLSMGPDRFAISKTIDAPHNLPVALVANPSTTRTLAQVIKDDQIFMQNNFSIQQLTTILEDNLPKEAKKITPYVLKNAIKSNMKITWSVGNNLHITYFGKKKVLGELLVNYYSDRLEKKIGEGIQRSGKDAAGMKAPDFSAKIEMKSYKSVWRPERIVPLAICSIVTFSALLILMGILEWSDPSFKSERQMSRYLDLPVIGSVPDLNKISVQLEGR
jgi:capsular polysaccharide biosynthesis protein